MSTHNIHFHGKIRKILVISVEKNVLSKSEKNVFLKMEFSDQSIKKFLSCHQ